MINIKNQNNDCYFTSSLALAATLALWHPIITIDKSEPKKSLFGFKKDPDVDRLVAAFWSNDLKVDPLLYFNQLKLLKTRLYEG